MITTNARKELLKIMHPVDDNKALRKKGDSLNQGLRPQANALLPPQQLASKLIT
jgi:hypothetical protein